MLTDEHQNACVHYVLQTLLADTDADSDVMPLIYYGTPECAPVHAILCIIPSDFFSQYGKFESLPRLPLESIDGTPLLYGKPVISWHGNLLCIHGDIVASAYFMLTGYEEMLDVNRDKHGRFTGQQSFALKAGILRRPIVDEYRILLMKWFNLAGLRIQDQRKFNVVLSHDVDHLFKYGSWLQVARAIFRGLKSASISEPWRAIQVWLGHLKDPFDHFEWMAQLDQACIQRCSFEAKAIYYFMAGGLRPNDLHYEIRSKEALAVIALVKRYGALSGLHSSYASADQPERLKSEKQQLEGLLQSPVILHRHHYLRWRGMGGIQCLESIGILQDSSLAYADVIGYRAGTCRPFFGFNPFEFKQSGVRIHPLSIMDGTLHNNRYLNLDYAQARKLCLDMIDKVKTYNGELVLLWHNNVFDEGYHRKLYPELLEHLVSLQP
ncbi:virulence modulating gene E [Oleiphilus messinensis]|uniref:Virulence modulating gene E n=1 Tax=Oleiphilus messinensis TaxID=141451 RepID=A0A1Y0IJ17_9GAMM|nr:polysaccharide deacetylase family protein [Oleiphilus messinensis]ARU59515.1 virulence modulating gene E [Oleiphilus messinensis]